MLARLSFWLGLLLGGLTSFSLRGFWLPMTPRLPMALTQAAEPFWESVGEAVVVCDSTGTVTNTNAAARALLGQQAEGIGQLCYPSGQKVPAGQLPLNRALRTGKPVTGAGYRFTSETGRSYALEVRVNLLPDGGAAATVKDMTDLEEGLAREVTVLTREQVLRDLCRRLTAAPDAAQLARAVVESAQSLGKGLPDLRVRLYTYDSESKLLTRLASVPEERPKVRQRPSPTFSFEATSSLLWSVYVARQPYMLEQGRQDGPFWTALGEEGTGAAYAVPLLAGGGAVGHLSFTSSMPSALADEQVCESFHLLASVAALALAGPQQAAQTAHLAEQVGALREVVHAVGAQLSENALADLVSRSVLRVTNGEVCTIAVRQEDSLRLIGTSYEDALLFPDRFAPNDPVLGDAATREAVGTGKTVQHVGLVNPRFDNGLWRAFAGQSGKHSILALPLGAGQGALTVWVRSESPFPAAQIMFLETMAALLTAALPPSRQAGASLSAGPEGP